jgi:hypothetical protein
MASKNSKAMKLSNTQNNRNCSPENHASLENSPCPLRRSSRSNSARKNPVASTSVENLKRANLFTDSNRFNHPSAFSSQIKLHGNTSSTNKFVASSNNSSYNFPIVTPEKTKLAFTSNLRNRNDTVAKNKSIISFSPLGLATTEDKSKSPKKKNCYICRIKPVKIVSDIIDIEDPDMLEKIENSRDDIKPCACSSPDKECVNCSSNSVKTKKLTNSGGQSSNKKYISEFAHAGYNQWANFNDSTPNKLMPTINTPGYARYNIKKEKDSDTKINLAKYG